MKLTLQIKILPDNKQADLLIKTIKEANSACNTISNIAWNKKCFQQFRLHKECYYEIKSAFNLSSQMIVRVISKVSDAYKLDRKTRRVFNEFGAISYDNRILTFKPNNIVSIWSIGGRLKIPFICHNTNYIPFIKGEADLVYKNGKFYLFQTVDIPDEYIDDVEEFIGVDFGQTDVATLSDGVSYNSESIKKIRKKYSKVRASVQAKGTRSSRKLLKRLSGRERRFVSISNHTIAKQIVEKAKSEKKGIAIEDLSNIRNTAKPKSKNQKTELNRWAFNQLRRFLTYKAKKSGVRLIVVPPAYTSKMCSDCLHIGKRNAKRFKCENCGNIADADVNAAKNIATWGCIINQPEKQSIMYCDMRHNCCLKP